MIFFPTHTPIHSLTASSCQQQHLFTFETQRESKQKKYFYGLAKYSVCLVLCGTTTAEMRILATRIGQMRHETCAALKVTIWLDETTNTVPAPAVSASRQSRNAGISFDFLNLDFFSNSYGKC